MHLLACLLQMGNILRPDIFDNNNTTICDEKYVEIKKYVHNLCPSHKFFNERNFQFIAKQTAASTNGNQS